MPWSELLWVMIVDLLIGKIAASCKVHITSLTKGVAPRPVMPLSHSHDYFITWGIILGIPQGALKYPGHEPHTFASPRKCLELACILI